MNEHTTGAPDREHTLLPIANEATPWWRTFLPGGPAAWDVGTLVIALGLVVWGVGMFGRLQYDEAVWRSLGMFTAAVGVLWFLVPQESHKARLLAARAWPAVTDVRPLRLIKQRWVAAPTRWWVEVEFTTEDGLSHRVRARLAHAKEAYLVGTQQVEIVLRHPPEVFDRAEVFLAPREGG